MAEFEMTYTCGPVAQKFHKDKESRVKLVLGPFGCLSADTEYLSIDGWKRFNEYHVTDIIAEFNKNTNQIEFRKPKNYVKFPCEEFYHLKNENGIDQLLSEEHTVIYDTRYASGEWKTINAKELVEKHNSLKDGFSGRIPTIFDAPNLCGVDLSDDELRLMVAISADGHFPKKSSTNRCTIAVRKERKKERIREILTRCEIAWDENNSPDRPTETRFVFNAPERNKLLWKYIHATKKQLEIVVDEFVHWDGCIDKYGGRIFSTIIKENADFIQYALATTGVRATIAEVDYKDKGWNKGYRVYANTGTPFIGLRQAPKIKKVPSVDGFKYCFESTTGFFVARRNGRIFITGNTGKTSSAAYDVIEMMSDRVLPVNEIKKSRFAVVRNSYPQLRDTTIKTYLDWFPPLYFGKYNATNKQYLIKYDGKEIEILFKALDSPEDVRDLLSLELTGAHIDEAREVHEDNFKGLLGRVGRFPSLKDTGGQSPFITPPQVILTTNYPSTEHWIYRDFVENPIKGYTMYQQTQEENKHNLRKGYYEDLEHDYANRPDLLRTLVRGEWGITIRGKQVYPEFVRGIHVSPKPIILPNVPMIIRGWDNTGLSPACIITAIGSTGQWLIKKEFCGEDIGILDFGEMVQLYCAQQFGSKMRYRDIGDPAGTIRDSNKMSPAAYLRKLGIFIEDGIQTFQVRREAVSGRLTKLINGQPSILVDPSCTRLIDGFEGGYAYPEIGNSGVFKTDPAKNEYSHVADALQYPATRLFVTPKKEKNYRKPTAYRTASIAGY